MPLMNRVINISVLKQLEKAADTLESVFLEMNT